MNLTKLPTTELRPLLKVYLPDYKENVRKRSKELKRLAAKIPEKCLRVKTETTSTDVEAAVEELELSLMTAISPAIPMTQSRSTTDLWIPERAKMAQFSKK